MPRQPRHFVPGYPVHAVARGVNRQPVFFEASDYSLYLSVVHWAAGRYGCAIHAYVLMTNHVHLLMTPDSVKSIPRLFQAVGRSYVQSVNRKYGRTGTLWEGRYRPSLVDSDAYALSCYRYIELNPVRAGLVANPALYAHSSYRCNALGIIDPLVTPQASYLALGSDVHSRQAAYASLFSSPIDEAELSAIRRQLNRCGVLGTERFKDEVEAVLGYPVRPARMGRPGKLDSSRP